jgi:hypothetical protein
MKSITAWHTPAADSDKYAQSRYRSQILHLLATCVPPNLLPATHATAVRKGTHLEQTRTSHWPVSPANSRACIVEFCGYIESMCCNPDVD